MAENFQSDNNKELKGESLQDKDALQFEYQALLNEYQTINTRISRRIEEDERTFQLTIVALSIVLAVSSLAVDKKVYILLLLLALPFHALIWAYLRRALEGTHLAEYIIEVVAPRINTIIQRTAIKQAPYGKPLHFISWEGHIASANKRSKFINLIAELSHGGRLLLHLSTAIVLVIVYLVLQKNNPQYATSVLDTGLLILNILISIVSLVCIFMTYAYIRDKNLILSRYDGDYHKNMDISKE